VPHAARRSAGMRQEQAFASVPTTTCTFDEPL
jgi:hypothetical protein